MVASTGQESVTAVMQVFPHTLMEITYTEVKCFISVNFSSQIKKKPGITFWSTLVPFLTFSHLDLFLGGGMLGPRGLRSLSDSRDLILSRSGSRDLTLSRSLFGGDSFLLLGEYDRIFGSLWSGDLLLLGNVKSGDWLRQNQERETNNSTMILFMTS